MLKKSKVFLALAMFATVMTSCNNQIDYETFDIGENEYIPAKYKGKDVYKAYIATALKSLNSPITMQAENSQHISNFVDGLLENDAYGRLSKALAEKVFVNESYTEFKFYIRGGVENPIPWMTHEGVQYVDRIEGPQVVTGEDFVEAARLSLNATNLSECYYLPAMFIKGGYEYWAYTYALYYRDNLAATQPLPSISTSELKTDAGLAKATILFAKQYGHIDLNITESDIADIAAFKRVGIKAGKELDAETNKEYYYVTYELENPASYFPSVLTYTPFLPVNKAFIENNVRSVKQYGRSNNNFLYNGAFILSEWGEKTLVYKKNNSYWDAKNVHVNRIEYTVLPDNTNDDFIRKEFEKGNIDSFGISQNDTDGWRKYVTGKDGKGTIENPVSEEVYSREIDTIDSTFYTQLNVNRSSLGGSSMLKQAESDNANAAIKLSAVRELLLDGVDLTLYNKRYGLVGDLRDQYQMWTLIPKGFVENPDNGKDYIEYVYEEYANQFGGTKEDAAELLKQGRLPEGYAENQKAKTQALAQKAFDAIEAVNNNGGVSYNVSGVAKNDVTITYPIRFEYLGLAFDAKQRAWDAEWIEEFNDTVNACTTNKSKTGIPQCKDGKYPKIEIVQNTKVTAQSYTNMGQNGEYHLYVVGWGADYADPLTYLNTAVTGGDMCDYAGTATAVPDYIVEDGVVTRKDSMLDVYDELVFEGAAIDDNTDLRFETFAKAEVELLFNVHIISPAYMQGQGWSVTVSKLAGYETPSAAYGLSSYKLKGVYALTETMGGAERKTAKAKFENNKAQALADSKYSIYEDTKL